MRVQVHVLHWHRIAARTGRNSSKSARFFGLVNAQCSVSASGSSFCSDRLSTTWAVMAWPAHNSDAQFPKFVSSYAKCFMHPAFISRLLRALFSLDFSVRSAIGPSQRFREIAWLCSDTLQCRVSFPRCISDRFLHGLKKLLRYETAVGMDASRVYTKSGWDECLDDDWDVIRVDQTLQSYNGMSSGVEWREAFRTWRRLDKELAAHLHLFTDAAQPSRWSRQPIVLLTSQKLDADHLP